uniref:Uncharacterized protein n=1 Tax=Parascaris equorum TaxID=6256 RepID=A0A914RJU4_PAREQ
LQTAIIFEVTVVLRFDPSTIHYKTVKRVIAPHDAESLNVYKVPPHSYFFLEITERLGGINLTAFIPTALVTKKDGDKKVLKSDEMDYSPLVNRLEEHVTLAAVPQQRKMQAERYVDATIMEVYCALVWLTRGRDGPTPKRVRFGVYVTILYIFVKFLWLVNVVVQFLILNIFLGPQYTFWGIGIYIEKFFEIFLFLWFWFCFVAIVTSINFLYWLFVSLSSSQSRSFIRKYLNRNGCVELHPDSKLPLLFNHRPPKNFPPGSRSSEKHKSESLELQYCAYKGLSERSGGWIRLTCHGWDLDSL